MRRLSLQSRTLWALAVAMAAATPLAPVTAQQPSIQQQFDAASAALEAEHWDEALRLFEAMEARARSPRSLAIIRTRKASALIELGRLDEAAQALRVALPDLPADDASLHVDRYLGLVTLGRISEGAFDYAEALRLFQLAAAVPIPEIDRLTALRGLVQTQLFSDPEAALRAADRALATVAAAAPGNRPIEGMIRTLRGRALLNLRRYGEARLELEQAMRRLGNLTLRVDRADLVARSDLAIAALLAGRNDDARQYLAYTGAGRFGANGFLSVEGFEPPSCGTDAAPGDVFVIQAAVADDGSTSGVMPIYASRAGPGALLFARAVAGWRFDRESIMEIPPLLRSVVRLELRCSTDPHHPSDTEDERAIGERLGAADPDWRSRFEALEQRTVESLRTELAALDRDGAPPRAMLPALLALGRHPALTTAEQLPLLRRALTAAAAAQAPPRALAAIAIEIARHERAALDRRDRGPPDFAAMRSMPEVAAAPGAVAAILLVEARLKYLTRQDEEARRLIAEARATPGLGAGDPGVREAFGLEAAIRAAAGDMEGGRAAAAASGDGPERCGPSRRTLRIAARDSDFPMEALAWGFEGWATTETSIDAAGRAASARVIMAYPPFVFGDAAREIALRTRYDPAYRAEGMICPPVTTRVRFVLPGPAERRRRR